MSEKENFTDFHDSNALVWYLSDLTFGEWADGPDQDGNRLIDLDLDVPEVTLMSLRLTAGDVIPLGCAKQW